MGGGYGFENSTYYYNITFNTQWHNFKPPTQMVCGRTYLWLIEVEEMSYVDRLIYVVV